MMDLDPWRSPGVVEVVEESHEASCLIKNLLKKFFDPHLVFDGPCTLEDDDVVITDLMRSLNPWKWS